MNAGRVEKRRKNLGFLSRQTRVRLAQPFQSEPVFMLPNSQVALGSKRYEGRCEGSLESSVVAQIGRESRSNTLGRVVLRNRGCFWRPAKGHDGAKIENQQDPNADPVQRVNHSGMFPCFLRGLVSRLFSRERRAVISLARV